MVTIEPVTWKSGDVITAEKLNKMGVLATYANNVTSSLDLTYQDVETVVKAGVPVVIYFYPEDIEEGGAASYVIFCGEGNGIYPNYYITTHDYQIWGADNQTDNLRRWSTEEEEEEPV